MNIWDIALIAALAVAIGLAVRRVIRVKKQGGCSCGGSCGSCTCGCGGRKTGNRE